jgi:hypothetical protein
MPPTHQSNSSQSVATSTTFSTSTTLYRCTSVARMTSMKVARVRSNAPSSTGSSSPVSRASRSNCAFFRLRPPAGLISVQIGDAHNTSVLGKRRMS